MKRIFEEALRELDDLGDLKNDWDDDGAPEISNKAIEASKKIVCSLQNNSDIRHISVCPSIRGGVGVLFCADHWRIHVSIVQKNCDVTVLSCITGISPSISQNGPS